MKGNPTEQELREVEEDCRRMGFPIPAPRSSVPKGEEEPRTTAIYDPPLEEQIRGAENRTRSKK